MMKLFNKYREIILYLIFGVLTTLVSLVTYYILVKTFLNPKNGFELQMANIISWCISVMFAYFTNRKYVFESHNDNKIKELFKFVSSRLITLFMDMTIMFIGVIVINFDDKIVKIISQVVIIIANYLFSKLIVFNKKVK